MNDLVPSPQARVPQRPWRQTDFAAEVSLQAGAVRFEASAHCSALGFAAIGALVSAILLSVPPIVRAARERS